MWRQVRKFISKLFGWKYTGVALPACAGLGLAAIYANETTLGYAFWGVGAIWAIGFWLSASNPLIPKNPVPPRKRKKIHKSDVADYAQQRRRYIAWKSGGVVLMAMILIAAFISVENWREDQELMKFSGVLIPAHDSPKNNCPEAPPNALFIYTGSSIAFSNGLPLSMFEVNGKRELTLSRDPEGNLLVNLDVYGPDGKVIAVVEKNEFAVNRNNVLQMVRPDRSTLILKDQFNQLFYLRYLNASAILVEGTFRFPGIPPIVFSNEGEFIGGGRFSHMCMGFTKAGGVIFPGLRGKQ